VARQVGGPVFQAGVGQAGSLRMRLVDRAEEGFVATPGQLLLHGFGIKRLRFCSSRSIPSTNSAGNVTVTRRVVLMARHSRPSALGRIDPGLLGESGPGIAAPGGPVKGKLATLVTFGDP